MRKNQLHNIPKLKGKRRALRHSLTKAEAMLWKEIQDSKLCGRKFRRQHSIGSYIVDYYCPKEKLAVELDGSQHVQDENIEYDNERIKYLNELGIRVIRFYNYDVYHNLAGVLESIEKEFKTTPLSPHKNRRGQIC
jgi:very-short-patch-repair endonuclease